MTAELCFVLMPFGQKPDQNGRTVNFDRVYQELIKPAIEAAGLEPIRADEEMSGGIIHKPMYERLMLCDVAVADLTTANANVFYELGIRHGIRPHSTVLIFAQGLRLPFDVAPLRGLPYALDAAGGPATAEKDSGALTTRLRACTPPVEDSPLFQLVGDWPRPDIARLKTDRFRELVAYSQKAKVVKNDLAAARKAGKAAVQKIGGTIDLEKDDPAIVIDLFLSYRAVKDFEGMVKLAEAMPEILSRTTMVREQKGFALNRLNRRDEAEAILRSVIEDQGPSSETNGLLGRVYKDRWDDAVKSGSAVAARGWLKKAIDTYLAGYLTDIRDAFPGINAVTLMEMEEPPNPRQAELLPAVRLAVKNRLAGKAPDYWDRATLLELAVLAGDQPAAEASLAEALTSVREAFEPETTARNLRLIESARSKRGQDAAWIGDIAKELERAHAELAGEDKKA